MTQPINENDVMEITIEGSNEQRPWAIVRHYIASTVADPADWLVMLTNHWVNEVLDSLVSVTTTLWVAECITIGRVAPGPRSLYFHALAPALTGVISTDGLPPQSSVLCRMETDEPGARNRGRCYLTGCPEASTNGGVLLASVQAAWEVVGDKMAEVLSDAGNVATPCVFSRTAYNPAADPPQAYTAYTAIITSTTIQGNIATQRRRRVPRNTFSA